MTTEPSPTTGSTDEWTTAPLVALDLEGSGAQERDDEAVLEIAVVPLVAGQARRINGHILVGQNIGVDWRLLHRRHPTIAPSALIDTLRLARHLKLGAKNSLSALTAQ